MLAGFGPEIEVLFFRQKNPKPFSPVVVLRVPCAVRGRRRLRNFLRSNSARWVPEFGSASRPRRRRRGWTGRRSRTVEHQTHYALRPNKKLSQYFRVDRSLPNQKVEVCFLCIRLFSRRCHTISTMAQLISCPSQNRTSGFPIHPAPRVVIQQASALRHGFRSLRILGVGHPTQARA